MSSFSELDNALIKSGYILKTLITAIEDIPDINLHKHEMDSIQNRLRQAMLRGLSQYNHCKKLSVSETVLELSFDTLHNDAYASDPDCPLMRAFQWSFSKKNRPWPKPLAFRASCDASAVLNK